MNSKQTAADVVAWMESWAHLGAIDTASRDAILEYIKAAGAVDSFYKENPFCLYEKGEWIKANEEGRWVIYEHLVQCSKEGHSSSYAARVVLDAYMKEN